MLAYLDPGTGSLLVYLAGLLIVGGVVAGLVWLWRRS